MTWTSGPESTVPRPVICPKPTRGRTIQNWLPSRATPSAERMRRMRTTALFSSLESDTPLTSPTYAVRAPLKAALDAPLNRP